MSNCVTVTIKWLLLAAKTTIDVTLKQDRYNKIWIFQNFVRRFANLSLDVFTVFVPKNCSYKSYCVFRKF